MSRNTDRALFNNAVQQLKGFRTALEWEAEDNPGTKEGEGPYTNVAWGKNNVCKYQMKQKKEPCTDEVSKELLEDRIKDFKLTIISEDGKPDSSYRITGKSIDRLHCKICVTPNGVFPKEYNEKDCAAGTCPQK